MKSVFYGWKKMVTDMGNANFIDIKNLYANKNNNMLTRSTIVIEYVNSKWFNLF